MDSAAQPRDGRDDGGRWDCVESCRYRVRGRRRRIFAPVRWGVTRTPNVVREITGRRRLVGTCAHAAGRRTLASAKSLVRLRRIREAGSEKKTRERCRGFRRAAPRTVELAGRLDAYRPSVAASHPNVTGLRSTARRSTTESSCSAAMDLRTVDEQAEGRGLRRCLRRDLPDRSLASRSTRRHADIRSCGFLDGLLASLRVRRMLRAAVSEESPR